MDGALIAVDGIDGSGKTTVVELLKYELTKRAPNDNVIVLREPGGTLLAEEIRTLFKGHDHKKEPFTPVAQLMLIQAARAQLFHNIILPELRKGSVVILDRHLLSTIAYQQEVPFSLISSTYLQATGTTEDLPLTTLYLDVTVEESKKRRGLREEQDNFEKAADLKMESIRTSMIENLQRVNGLYVDTVKRTILEVVEECLCILDSNYDWED